MLLCLNNKSLSDIVKDFQMHTYGSTTSEAHSCRSHYRPTILELEDVVFLIGPR